MWAFPALALAGISGVGRCRADLAEREPKEPQLLAADVPLERWKRIRLDGRVLELLHGSHFDDLLQDTPDSFRPPSLIFIHDGRAPDRPGTATLHEYMQVADRGVLGQREQLLIASYDAGEAPRRIWFHMNPERNLTHRFLRPRGVVQLPQLVFVPRKCNGWTEWCDPGGKERIVGGECYVEQCSDWEVIEPDKAGSWVDVVNKLVSAEERPKLQKNLRSFQEQGQWLCSRDTSTTREHLEVLQQPRSIPRFTKKGFKLVEIPTNIQDLLIHFYQTRNNTRRAEKWNSWGQTQINGHEVQTHIVDIQARDVRGKYFAEITSFMLPRLEKWVGVPLELTSLYGMREYNHPVTLRGHLDRPDVLVVSVTFSVYQEGFDQKKWPLEVLSFDGKQYRMEHPQGTMMYYESATLQHGKPGKLPVGGLHVGLFLHYRPKQWLERGYIDLGTRRTGRAVRIVEDNRPRATGKQEQWPAHYYEHSGRETTDYADLEEGRYMAINNTCADPTEQRDDVAYRAGIAQGVAQASRTRLGQALLRASALVEEAAAAPGLLDEGADVDFADANGWRPIHEASRAGNVDILRLLLSRRADANALTADRESALQLARKFHGGRIPELEATLRRSEL